MIWLKEKPRIWIHKEPTDLRKGYAGLAAIVRHNIKKELSEGERDIRMTKVHQKISVCFRSFFGAEIFCRTRSFLGSLQKQGVEPMQGLIVLFSEDWEAFSQNGFVFE